MRWLALYISESTAVLHGFLSSSVLYILNTQCIMLEYGKKKITKHYLSAGYPVHMMESLGNQNMGHTTRYLRKAAGLWPTSHIYRPKRLHKADAIWKIKIHN